MGSLFDGKYIQWGNRFLPITEAYLEPIRKSTIKLFRKKPDLRFRLGSKYASVLSPC